MKKILLSLFFVIFLALAFSFGQRDTEQKIVLKFSSWGSQSETLILNQIISDYEKDNPNVKIDFVHIPQNYFQKLQLLFASGLEPDIVFLNNQNIKMYINAGLLEDISNIVNKDLYYKTSIDCFSSNGKIYAIPRDISNLVIFYNKDLLKKKLKFLNFKHFIEELIKLKSDKYYVINYEENLLFLSYYLAANGGGILSDDSSSLKIDKKESIEAFNLYSKLVNEYNVIPNKAQVGSKTSAQMFINGELAMYLGGRWMVPKFREVISFDWDIVAFPSSTNNKLYVDSSAWAVTKKSKNKAEAIKFVQYLSSDEVMGKLAQTGLIIPAKKNVAEKMIKTEKYPSNSIVFIDMLENTKPTPVNENYSSINDIITQKVISIISGSSSFEEAFDEKTIEKLKRLL